MSEDYQVTGTNDAAPFTLKVYRGEGMALLAMNWKQGRPPADFVGFGIEYREPGSDRFLIARNRLNFDGAPNPKGEKTFPSLTAPIQKFRWIVFPYNAALPGLFEFRVTPMFMDEHGILAAGPTQSASIELASATHPGKLNIAFTRGYVSSQAFVDHFGQYGAIPTLLPGAAKDGLTFTPTHPKADEALGWMGFEARREILALLDGAIADPNSKVAMVAYDLSERHVVDRLEQLGNRLRIIIDDSADHGEEDSGETQTATRLEAAGAQVKRQHMGQLQHNKTLIVEGQTNAGVFGSTNYAWRGLYVQSNNAIVVSGEDAIKPLKQAFDDYWNETGYKASPSPAWHDLGLAGIDAKVSFSPHGSDTARLGEVAADIDTAKTSLLYSLAFFSQTPGPVKDAITKATRGNLFVYGISDKKTGISLLKPDGNPAPVYFARLSGKLPPPFVVEPNTGMGTNMHHKFVVIDFNTPDARVWCGSYNFSNTADTKNGENLLLIRDRKVATSYMIEALRIFDTYHFRVAMDAAKRDGKPMTLAKPPASGAAPWWQDDWDDPRRKRDRELFAGRALT